MSLLDRFLKPLKKLLKIKNNSKPKGSSRGKRIVKKKSPSRRGLRPARRFLAPKRVAKKIKKAKVRSSVRGAKKQKKALSEVLVGEVTHFFSKIQVVVVKITNGQIQAGERIHIKGHKRDFYQTVKSLQIESVDVKTAHKGQLVGLKVDKKAKEGDKVYK